QSRLDWQTSNEIDLTLRERCRVNASERNNADDLVATQKRHTQQSTRTTGLINIIKRKLWVQPRVHYMDGSLLQDGSRRVRSSARRFWLCSDIVDDMLWDALSGRHRVVATLQQNIKIGTISDGGGPILYRGKKACNRTGHRHLEPSSATRQK